MMFALALAAATPSFDCAKATSAVERMICVDPLLSRLDRAMATAYRSVRRNREQKDEQRAILRRRDACATRECVRDAYQSALPGLLTGREPGGMVLVSRPNHGTLRLLEIGDGWIAFSVIGMWPTYGGSWNFAEDGGILRLVNEKGGLRDDESGCGVDIQRLAPRRWSVTRTMAKSDDGCDGWNATIDGIYR